MSKISAPPGGVSRLPAGGPERPTDAPSPAGLVETDDALYDYIAGLEARDELTASWIRAAKEWMCREGPEFQWDHGARVLAALSEPAKPL